jgi:hypothetical protein
MEVDQAASMYLNPCGILIRATEHGFKRRRIGVCAFDFWVEVSKMSENFLLVNRLRYLLEHDMPPRGANDSEIPVQSKFPVEYTKHWPLWSMI